MTDTAEPASTLPRVRWGILSTGHIAGVFARDLALLPDEAELTAVASRTPEKASAFAAEHGFARSYGSYAELVDDPDVEVVYIASPHSDHFASAKLCLEAGKSVLVEKPLTTSFAETDELIRLAAEKQLFLMEALWTRTNPLLRRAAEIARSGELGPIRHVEVSFGFRFTGDDDHRLVNPDLAGGAILDLGVYPTHVVNLFLGEPESVHGYGYRARTGVDAHAAAVYAYPATAQRPAATASALCTLDLNPANRTTVYCEDGRIEIGNVVKPESITVVRSPTGDPAEGQPEETSEELTTQLPGGGYTLQAQEVMQRLRAGELESPLVPWVDTLGVARTLDRWLDQVGGPGRVEPGRVEPGRVEPGNHEEGGR
ncbi:oxidoreductase [Microlunatus endophyticus]|uniref:Oxidoreductase n=1 Tax=Microlunatus endophyticus TaxID=1716077 RepID=A0A917S545_9ACTN|nr:Gfo/Idh/MocA family oxidoreductase [Microlunatus endophyticus]GGL57724.1 oxidoreductase [Microlunatus endophyticus]